MKPSDSEPMDEALAQAVCDGDRRALARAITLVESTLPEHAARAQALLARLLPHTGKALRVGLSGVPGVGKSTFIESFGLHLTAAGHRVAVLAVDPSSRVSGGSILGDKTRMEGLARDGAAFIRPSPAAGTLGGVAARTREVMLLAEASGYDVVIIETVGVGQSETAVADLCDAFVLLQLPNAGDELQAMKKGVVELADIIAINKRDIDPAASARAAQALRTATHLLAGSAGVPVLEISALKREGIAELWDAVQVFVAREKDDGRFELRRSRQALAWLEDEVQRALRARFEAHPAVREVLQPYRAAVAQGELTPTQAAADLLRRFEI
ncbi:methylmalonyl Co-A mutase-associated GTPase MeaB [Niveibacterium sp. SC-1]|uniref:methylmalonyl Co-A mutase-associated GTPase MeaB n=1 Tax=Niveibacterium sp. SC-1 TaxID=3135646 RepID=UPI00311D6002